MIDINEFRVHLTKLRWEGDVIYPISELRWVLSYIDMVLRDLEYYQNRNPKYQAFIDHMQSLVDANPEIQQFDLSGKSMIEKVPPIVEYLLKKVNDINTERERAYMNDRRLDGIEIDSRVCDYIYLDHTGLSFDDTISKDDDKNQNKIIKLLRRIYFRAGRSTADEQQSQLRDFGGVL